MYERAIETCYLLNDPAAALYFFEKSRAVLLSDKLNELNANQRLSAVEVQKEKELRRRSNEIQGQLGQLTPTDTAVAGLRSQLLETQKEQEAFMKNIERSNPQYYRYKYDNRIPDLGNVRQKLLGSKGHESAFLTYFLGDSALYGISIRKGSILFKKLNLSEFLRNQQEFRNTLVNREQQNRHFDHYLAAAHRLYQNLVAPFAIPKGTKLIVSPDGDFIPFAAMSLSAKQPDYLIRYHAISYTYSARFLEVLPQPAPTNWWTERSFLGMAPVEFSPSLQQATLAGSDEALSQIQGHFLFPKSLTGKDATRQAFLTEAPLSRVVQLYTHAEADSTRTPKLYFADSVLSLSDLASASGFRTQLMVLSACKTGLGKLQRGEGVFSMARGLAGLGVPTTLTTLWSVEDKAMYGLNQLFYRYLADGLPLDEALQKAQLEWLATMPRGDQLPYAWAGVVLIGRTDPVATHPISRTSYIALFSFLLVSALGLTFYLVKRKHNP